MQGSNLVGNAWQYAFWSKVLALNVAAFHLSWWIWGIFLAVAIIYTLYSLAHGASVGDVIGCLGCGGLILLLLPLGAWLNMVEAAGIVASMSATAGIVNVSNFVVSVVLFFVFGIF
jgi:hypothetical protein